MLNYSIALTKCVSSFHSQIKEAQVNTVAEKCQSLEPSHYVYVKTFKTKANTDPCVTLQEGTSPRKPGLRRPLNLKSKVILGLCSFWILVPIKAERHVNTSLYMRYLYKNLYCPPDSQSEFPKPIMELILFVDQLWLFSAIYLPFSKPFRHGCEHQIQSAWGHY